MIEIFTWNDEDEYSHPNRQKLKIINSKTALLIAKLINGTRTNNEDTAGIDKQSQ